MPGIRSIQQKLQRLSVDLRPAVLDAIDQTKEDYLALNREQMMEGKNRYGGPLAPSYLDDPYFKTRESAQRYAKWKDHITPNAARPSGTPNLYITGKYQRSIQIVRDGDKLVYEASFKAASKIEGTYKGLYGLSPAFQVRYMEIFRPIFNQGIRNLLSTNNG